MEQGKQKDKIAKPKKGPRGKRSFGRTRKRASSSGEANEPAARSFPSSPGLAFERLVEVMARLRGPGGCPWDREQTHFTLRAYLIEEAYEVLDALDRAEDPKFAEELGDLLLQIVFHSQIAAEEVRFSVVDVIREIYEKMIRRHPHVFGEKRAKDAAEVLRNWELIKRREREADAALGQDPGRLPSAAPLASTPPPSLLDGVPGSLPGLLEGFQLTRKAAAIGFDWESVEGVFAKLHEEVEELRCLLDRSTPGLAPNTSAASLARSQRIEDEVGDILFVAVNLARFLRVDPEIAMKKACRKFSDRFRTMERIARDQGTSILKVSRPQLESLWEQAKRSEQDAAPSEAAL